MDRLEGYLATCPDREKVEYVIRGLRFGFDLGYRGVVWETRPRNLLNTIEFHDGVTRAINKEIERGHTSGPFVDPPFHVVHVSPLGAVAKPDGSVRLILDLSSPRGFSINEGIDKEEFSCTYSHFDSAVEIVRQLGRGCYMAKIDIKHAFRLCPVRPDQWPLICFRWEGKYYVDTRLPFGGRSSPYIFNSLADLLCWVFMVIGGVGFIVHYLDDFFFANSTEESCRSDMVSVSGMCSDLGVPLAPDKVVGPSQVITFLGIEIDAVNFRVQLPEDKLKKIRGKIREFLGKKKVKQQELLSLIGLLTFASTVVRPGRMFLRRLIDLSMTVRSLHHFVSLNAEARLDLEWWDRFVTSWNGVSLIPSPTRSSPDMDFFTDASDLGFGAVFGKGWVYSSWPDEWKDTSINAREAFGIWVAVKVWGREWRDGQVVIHTDSAVNTAVWKTGTCKDKDVMRVVRAMFMYAASINLSITLLHIPGHQNIKADLLSRFKLDQFKVRFPDMEPRPSRIPSDVWDI